MKNSIANCWKLGRSLMTERERHLMSVLIVFLCGVSFVDMLAISSIAPFFKFVMSGGEIDFLPAFAQDLLAHFNPQERVLIFVCVPIALIACAFILNATQAWLILKFGIGRWQRMSRHLVAMMQNADSSWNSSNNSGEVVRICQQDISMWARDFVMFSLTVFADISLILVMTGILVYSLPLEGLIYFFAIALMVLVLTLISRPRLARYAEQARLAANEIQIGYGELLRGYKDIRFALNPKWFEQRIDFSVQRASNIHLYQNMWGKIPPQFITFLSQFSLLCIVLIMFMNNFTLPDIASNIAVLGVVASRVLPVANRLSVNFGKFWQVFPFLQGLEKLERDLQEHQITSKLSSTKIVPSENTNWNELAVELNEMYIGSDSGSKLTGISIKLRQGAFYGLVGVSGSGKTSLVDLIMGMRIDSLKSVSLDGVPVCEFGLIEYRSGISYVPQQPFLIDGTLAENVGFGETDLDRAWVEECLQRAGLAEFLQTLPQGIDTLSGDLGGRFSGGQKQRIAIARALYKKPKLLVLDEATSGLDNDMAQKMGQLFEELSSDIIVLFITHQCALLENASEIFVMRDGSVCERGTWKQLVNKEGAFVELLRDQRPKREVNV